MDQSIIKYIRDNWKKTINPKSNDVPFPFSSPSMSMYTDFFYWDLYFINKGLLLTGLDEQVENNIKNMAYFVNKLGYIPNSTTQYLCDRTQPPIFPLALYDLYLYRKDKKVI